MYDGIVGKIKDLVDEALDWYEMNISALKADPNPV
jgi:hypothetical protein